MLEFNELYGAAVQVEIGRVILNLEPLLLDVFNKNCLIIALL